MKEQISNSWSSTNLQVAVASAPPTSGLAKPGLAGPLSESILPCWMDPAVQESLFLYILHAPLGLPAQGPTQVEGTFLFLDQVVAFTPFLFLACDHHAQWAPGLPDSPGTWPASGAAVGSLGGSRAWAPALEDQTAPRSPRHGPLLTAAELWG